MKHWQYMQSTGLGNDNYCKIQKKGKPKQQFKLFLYFSNLYSTRTNTLLATGEVPWRWEALRRGGQVPNSKIHLTHNP